MIKVFIETKKGEIMKVCTCANEENVVREIMESYETIWQNTLNSSDYTKGKNTSNDPIINNWEGSVTLVECPESGELDIFQL
jgi:hypothetical protein